MKNLTVNAYKLIITLVSCSILFACATGSIIMTGQKRPATNPAEVQIYLDPPAEYETIGIVEASGEVGFSRQSAQDRIINKLKTLAAKSGANAILLVSSGAQSGASPGFYSNGFFYSGTSDKLTGQARAIVVIEEGNKQEDRLSEDK